MVVSVGREEDCGGLATCGWEDFLGSGAVGDFGELARVREGGRRPGSNRGRSGGGRGRPGSVSTGAAARTGVVGRDGVIMAVVGAGPIQEQVDKAQRIYQGFSSSSLRRWGQWNGSVMAGGMRQRGWPWAAPAFHGVRMAALWCSKLGRG